MKKSKYGNMRRKEFHAHDKLANDEKEKAGKDDEKKTWRNFLPKYPNVQYG